MFNSQVTSGITPQQTPSTATAYGRFRPQGGLMQSLYGQNAGRQSIQDQRSMMQSNAAYNQNAQTQRSNSGLRWGQLGNQAAMSQMNNEDANRNLNMSLLQAVLGGM